jgi:hypothetical protein
MPTEKLNRAHWQEFSRRISQGLMQQSTDIEITSPELGLDPGASWSRATRLTYDPVQNVLSIALDDRGHVTLRPHDLYIEMSDRGLESFLVLDHQNVWQVVLLRAPLFLPKDVKSVNLTPVAARAD